MAQSQNKFNSNARRLARRLVLQALYQWIMSAENLTEIERQFVNDNNMSKVDGEYFQEVLHNIPANLEKVDGTFKPYLDRKISELNPIELITLRIGAYELLKRVDIPYKVSIQEAVNLTKKFGTVEGYKYVNGVLDKVAKDLRKIEIGSNDGAS